MSRAAAPVDWSRWTPREHATLLYIVRDGHILLIHKKRGIGAGKLNGPGGRVAPRESPARAAVREVEEELGITPHGVDKRGEVWFHVLDGTAIRIHVFAAAGCAGEPRETEEAAPLWAPVDRIPYDRMWADDRFWLPHFLAGRKFAQRAVFDGDTLLAHELDLLPDDHHWE